MCMNKVHSCYDLWYKLCQYKILSQANAHKIYPKIISKQQTQVYLVEISSVASGSQCKNEPVGNLVSDL